MSLSIGIVGLPNVGKSTLFNALTKKRAEASNYPFCTIDPNVGVVKVPDARLNKIAIISKPERVLEATIEFIDIAGLVKGAHKGEGLGNQFLANIRECDAICEVVRDFTNDKIVHVDGKISPEDDKITIGMELIYADLQTIEKKLNKVIKDAKGNDKEIIKEKELLVKVKEILDKGKAVREIELTDKEKEILKPLHLLTQKPIIYILNIGSQKSSEKQSWDGKILSLNVKQEEEIASLDESEQAEYIKELGLEQSGLDKLIKASYELLGLISFFTTGTDETRAWTIKRGTKAPEAAGVIHTDFAKGFIRVEVIKYEDFIKIGGEQAAREKGLMKTEGKEYIISDGDICHFLHN